MAQSYNLDRDLTEPLGIARDFFLSKYNMYAVMNGCIIS
jgi:hypothetical protein